jgi:DNA-binding NarL/FixJ family response regulator
MIKILFLDDSSFRHQCFDKNHEKTRDIEISHAYDYESAVRMLSNNKFDIAYLDHDLSDADQLCNPDSETIEKTGSDVAKFVALELQPQLIPDLIIVHSFNPVGAKNMVNILEDRGIKAVWAPFHFYDEPATNRKTIS